jgi:hypothetical protein
MAGEFVCSLYKVHEILYWGVRMSIPQFAVSSRKFEWILVECDF